MGDAVTCEVSPNSSALCNKRFVADGLVVSRRGNFSFGTVTMKGNTLNAQCLSHLQTNVDVDRCYVSMHGVLVKHLTNR